MTPLIVYVLFSRKRYSGREREEREGERERERERGRESSLLLTYTILLFIGIQCCNITYQHPLVVSVRIVCTGL